jgi:hypothetical protein
VNIHLRKVFIKEWERETKQNEGRNKEGQKKLMEKTSIQMERNRRKTQ